jgi:hypothetical protein
MTGWPDPQGFYVGNQWDSAPGCTAELPLVYTDLAVRLKIIASAYC